MNDSLFGDDVGTPVPAPHAGGVNAGGGVEKVLESNPASAVCEWLASLRVSQGPEAGKRFTVLDWQRDFLEAALAPDVQQAALSVARGNGKTTLVAALASAFIVGPLRQPRAEAPVVAASYAQARIAFEHVRAFSEELFVPRAQWRVTDSLHWSLIEHRPTRARLRVMSSNPKRAHGLAPALVIADEPAQWELSGGDRMYSALATSLGKIPGARLIALGTRPASGDHWFARLLDTPAPGVVSRCYSASGDAELDDPEGWRAANPSLDFMPELERTIALEAAQCKANPSLLPAFGALRLNQGIHDSEAVKRLVDVNDWRNCHAQGPGEPTGPCVWGIDLGGSAALSAVAAYWPFTFRLDVRAAAGADPDPGMRGSRDGVGDLYLRAVRAGHLRIDEGRVPNVERLLRWALSEWGAPPVAVVADRWRMAELYDAAAAIPDLAHVEVVPRGQGFKDGADDVRRFQDAVLTRRIRPAGRHSLLEASIAEAVVVMDPSGNVKLAKHQEGRKKATARDDLVAASILAVAHARRCADRPQVSHQAAVMS